MGTCGLVGVRFNEDLHLIYQSHDSGPNHLGADVIQFVQKLQADPFRMLLFKENILKVEWVNDAAKPTAKQVKKLACAPEIFRSLNNKCDWYTQFIFDPLECLEYVILFELPVIPEHRKCTLGKYNAFIDYAYVLDLDYGTLDTYKNGCKVGKFCFEDLNKRSFVEMDRGDL